MKIIKLLLTILILSISLNAIEINVNKLIKDAKIQNKQVLVFFHMTYCPYCQKMLKENFENKNFLKQFNKHFVYLDINIDDEDLLIFNDFKGTQEEFAEVYDVNFYPTIIFLDESKISYTVKGYRNVEKFDKILKYIHTKSYATMDLPTFIDELEMSE
jgi:thioredoxin-related protein